MNGEQLVSMTPVVMDATPMGGGGPMGGVGPMGGGGSMVAGGPPGVNSEQPNISTTLTNLDSWGQSANILSQYLVNTKLV